MNHNKNSREQWLAILAAVVFVFGMGVVIGNTGFRIDAGALGNVFGLTPHQWGILLSGLVGSLAGGLVAVWVLRRTIEHQEANHRLQLRQAEKLHRKQLEAQRAEATRDRSHAAAATILSGLWLVNRASEAPAEEMAQKIAAGEMSKAIDSVILGAHNLRLEREHSDLAQALMAMNGELAGTPAVVPGNLRARIQLLQITAIVSSAVVVWFKSDGASDRKLALDSIEQAHQATANLVKADP